MTNNFEYIFIWSLPSIYLLCWGNQIFYPFLLRGLFLLFVNFFICSRYLSFYTKCVFKIFSPGLCVAYLFTSIQQCLAKSRIWNFVSFLSFFLLRFIIFLYQLGNFCLIYGCKYTFLIFSLNISIIRFYTWVYVSF